MRRGDRPYIIARAPSVPVAGIVDVSAIRAGRVSVEPVITLDWTRRPWGSHRHNARLAYRLV